MVFRFFFGLFLTLSVREKLKNLIFQMPVMAAQKTIVSFSRRPEKMVFPKKMRWNMIFLVLLGKIMFLFHENMILTLDGK